MRQFILILIICFSSKVYAQAMNTKGVELYERAISIQKDCVRRIIRFNRLLKSGKLTYNQESKLKEFKNKRIKLYKKMENVKFELESRKLVHKFSNKFGKSLK